VLDSVAWFGEKLGVKLKPRSEHVVAGAAAAAAFLLIALLIWSLSQQSRRYERDAANRSYQYARIAEQQITRRCVLAAQPESAECIEQAKQAAREYQRKEQDLAAQKTAAWWTTIAGAAAVFAAALSVLGVFLIWRTLHHTRLAARATQRMAFDTPVAIQAAVEANVAMREANETARDTARRQLRAYVSAHEVHILQPLVVGKIFKLQIDLYNSGETPAHEVIQKYAMIGVVAGNDPSFEFPAMQNEPSISTIGSNGKSQIYPQGASAVTQDVFDNVMAERIIIYIFGLIEYRDVFSEAHKTAFRVRYDPNGPGFLFTKVGNDSD
jgi:hypothetical protein